MRQLLLTLLLLASVFIAPAQIVGDMDDESKLYAQTKQVNQFFRRFNGEEDEKGERYYPADKLYRSVKLRRKYLGVLFDGSNTGITNDLRMSFTRDVLDKAEPGLLDFHGSNWFSEIQTTFTLNGKDVPVTLFMELEKDHLGNKWVISKVHSQAFDRYFSRDTTKVGKFLHPLSHELDFMNLRKAFSESDSISQFTVKRFVPDHLSVFLYEISKGTMKFKSVQDVKFHFFQIEGWYFELADFNRPGYNTGWLISNLVKINGPAEKELLRKHLLYESR
jgi:hypothetical protein